MNEYSISEGNLQQNGLYGKFRLWIYASPITQNTLCLVASWLGIWAGMWLMNYIIVWKHFDFTQFTICGFLAGLIGLSFWFTIEFFLVLKYKFSILKSSNETELESTNQYRSIRNADEIKQDARRTTQSHSLNFDKLTGRREVSPIEPIYVEPNYVPVGIETKSEDFSFGLVELIQDDKEFLFKIPDAINKNMPVSWEVQRKRYAAADSEWEKKPTESTTKRYQKERNYYVQCRRLRNEEEVRRAAVKQKIDFSRRIEIYIKSTHKNYETGYSSAYKIIGMKDKVLKYADMLTIAIETKVGIPDPASFNVLLTDITLTHNESYVLSRGCIYKVNQYQD